MASPDSAVFLTLTQERRFCSRLLAVIGGENINWATLCPIRWSIYDLIVTQRSRKKRREGRWGKEGPRVDLLACQEQSNIGCGKS
jgi:hypothetical protein